MCELPLSLGNGERMPTRSKTTAWYLESFATESRSLWRFALRGFPVKVGRRPGIGLNLPSPLISHEHAEIFLDGKTLRIRDLGSTNGTFINGVRIVNGEVVALEKGDVLHFANAEFVLRRLAAGANEKQLLTRTALHLDIPRQLVDRARQLNSLLRTRAVTATLQPIVDTQSAKVVAYEILGRGASARLPQSPKELFDIATAMGVAADLSRLFRAAGLKKLRGMSDESVLFFNTHPAEVEKPGLVESLHALRRALPKKTLVLEIHEQAVTSPAIIRALRRTLHDLDIRLAYDDFGAGRGRINELIDVPPDYLKFDDTLIKGIDSAPKTKRSLLQALVQVCRESNVRTIAEGVETEGEAQTVRDIGFDLAQGYLYGKPAPLAAEKKTKRRARRTSRARRRR